jgi:hypothetical protein
MITHFFYGKESAMGTIFAMHEDFKRVPHAMLGLAAAAVSILQIDVILSLI